MKKILSSLVTGVILLASCKTLTSNTIIKANESFVLGNNRHGSFKVKLRNVSTSNLDVYMAPVDGGIYSRQQVKPDETVSVHVESNTAIVIENATDKTASVDLKVSGDTGLSMGYKK